MIEFCKRVWVEKEMETMCDFLVWYNNCDVEPFLKAIEAQVDIYKSKRSTCSRQVLVSLEQPSDG